MRFKKAIAERAHAIALEVEGKQLSSAELATEVGRLEGNGATGTVAFLIGGSYGLPASVSGGARMKLGLSRMILPHRLARVVLLEQIYRAFTILRNEPYSH